MYDTIIRGANVIDGLGGPGYTADIAIQDGCIAEIGTVKSEARETVDADGAIATPGFIDLHTHFDGQFLWDTRLDPCFSHGVTTAIAGNCGVGFAPVEKHQRELLELMEGVEDIPGIVLDEGLDWSWHSFPDYLDKLEERHYSMDIGAQITHAPLRVYVMGERALRQEAATADDIARMCDLVKEAMAAGALGFSNGRHSGHVSSSGIKVPGTFAKEDEMVALAKAVGECGHGLIQHIPETANITAEKLGKEGQLGAHHLIEELARVSGRPVTYTVIQSNREPEDMPTMIGASERAWQSGLKIYPQVSPRGIGAIYMLDGYHVFLRKNSYREIAHLPRKERAAAMRDPARRAAILSEEDVDGEYADNKATMRMLTGMTAAAPRMYVQESPLNCEPGEDRRVAALAEKVGKTPIEFLYDHYSANNGEGYSVSYAANYALGDLDYVRELFDKPNTVLGLGDGGAHVRVIVDATMPTFALGYWTRERTRGERMSLGKVVKKLSADAAHLYGMSDRGTLEVGKRADINVIDYDRLTMKEPHMEKDLPSGAGRLLQDSVGYLATFVAGVATRRNDQDTGARPGRLIRSTK